LNNGVRCVVIKGPPGVGKTELAREFGRQHKKYFSAGLLWLELVPLPHVYKPYVPTEFVADGNGPLLIVVEDSKRFPNSHLAQALDRLRAEYPKATVLLTTQRQFKSDDEFLILGPLTFDEMRALWRSYLVSLTPADERMLFIQTGVDTRTAVLAGISIRDGHTTVTDFWQYFLRAEQKRIRRGADRQRQSVDCEHSPEQTAATPQNAHKHRSGDDGSSSLENEPAGDTSIEEYRDRLNDIQEILQISITITGSLEKGAKRQVFAVKLYTRLVVTLNSFVRLLPGNRITRDIRLFWDWGSVATVARVLIETYHAFFYIGVDNVPPDEAQARVDLMTLYIESERYRLYKAAGKEVEVTARIEEGLSFHRRQLENNGWFQMLPPKQQKRFLKGEAPLFLSRDEIEARIHVVGPNLRWLSRFFSNQVHSTPFAFSSQSDVRGRGAENEAERFYIILAMQSVARYVSRAVLDMADLFPDQVGIACPDAVERARQLFDTNRP